MKKVRLFAVAAALGMFAATVNAAAPKLTKDVHIGTWGTMDEIVRAEIGGKVVLPTPNFAVTKQTRSTEAKYAPKVDNIYGTGKLNVGECYEGFTSKIVNDTNADGIADYPVLFWGVDSTGASVSPSLTWYHDSYKFFPSMKTTMFYFGMTSNGYGARFMAPGQEAKEGWIMVEEVKNSDDERINYHGWYDVKDIDKLIGILTETGKVTLTYTEDRGENVLTGFTTSTVTTKATNEAGATETEKKRIKEVSKIEFRGDISNRKVEDDVKDAIVEYALTGDVTSAQITKNKYTYSYVWQDAAVDTKVDYKVTPVGFTGEAAPDSRTLVAGDATSALVVLVKQDRYGKYEVVDAALDSDAADSKAVASQFQYYKSFTNLLDAPKGKVTVYEIDSRTALNENDLETVRLGVFTPGKHGNDRSYEMVFNEDTAGFTKGYKVAPTAGGYTTGTAHMYGLYAVDTVANTTDKILMDFDMDGSGLGAIPYVTKNTTKKTVTFEDVNGDEFTIPYETVKGVDYPAFISEAAVLDFIKRMAGVYTPKSTVFADRKANIGTGSRTWLDGTKDLEYKPSNPLDHYKAKQCTYNVGEAVNVDASAIVYENNASSIDTNQYGIHNVTLTAKVGEEVVGTKDIKVVIAPKYVREYKNGKVTSLKAYHLNGNLYSHTTFDYATKKATAVFYAQDGVTAVETQSNDIK